MSRSTRSPMKNTSNSQARRRKEVTFGELIAAAYDALDGQEAQVLQVLCSGDLARRMGRRIVLL